MKKKVLFPIIGVAVLIVICIIIFVCNIINVIDIENVRCSVFTLDDENEKESLVEMIKNVDNDELVCYYSGKNVDSSDDKTYTEVYVVMSMENTGFVGCDKFSFQIENVDDRIIIASNDSVEKSIRPGENLETVVINFVIESNDIQKTELEKYIKELEVSINYANFFNKKNTEKIKLGDYMSDNSISFK